MPPKSIALFVLLFWDNTTFPISLKHNFGFLVDTLPAKTGKSQGRASGQAGDYTLRTPNPLDSGTHDQTFYQDLGPPLTSLGPRYFVPPPPLASLGDSYPELYLRLIDIINIYILTCLA